MTDPVTAIVLYFNRYVEMASLRFDLSQSDIRFFALVLAAFLLGVALLIALPRRRRSRKPLVTPAERAHLRAIRRERMPSEF